MSLLPLDGAEIVFLSYVRGLAARLGAHRFHVLIDATIGLVRHGDLRDLDVIAERAVGGETDDSSGHVIGDMRRLMRTNEGVGA